MTTPMTGMILASLFVTALVVIVTVAGAALSLMMKHSCPRCHMLMARKVLACPQCGAGTVPAL